MANDSYFTMWWWDNWDNGVYFRHAEIEYMWQASNMSGVHNALIPRIWITYVANVDKIVGILPTCCVICICIHLTFLNEFIKSDWKISCFLSILFSSVYCQHFSRWAAKIFQHTRLYIWCWRGLYCVCIICFHSYPAKVFCGNIILFDMFSICCTVNNTGLKPTWYAYMMTSSNGNIFRVTGHLCGEFTGPRWIPHTKASDAELWFLLWSAPE